MGDTVLHATLWLFVSVITTVIVAKVFFYDPNEECLTAWEEKLLVRYIDKDQGCEISTDGIHWFREGELLH